jgi:hypothetical protein
MNKNMLEFEGETYYIDVNAIMKWCLSSGNNPFKETEINEGYDTNDDGDIQMMTKVIRELKTNNVQDDTVRYDFIKLLLSPFFGEIESKNDIKENFSFTLMFNSLINLGFLVKV